MEARKEKTTEQGKGTSKKVDVTILEGNSANKKGKKQREFKKRGQVARNQEQQACSLSNHSKY